MRSAFIVLATTSLLASAHAAPSFGTGNDTCATAQVITGPGFVGGTLSSSLIYTPTPVFTYDTDWYRVTLQPNETMSAALNLYSLQHGDAFGYFLEVFDAGTGACPGTQISTSKTPIITNTTAAAHDYYLSVYAIGVPWSLVQYELLLHKSPLLAGTPYCAALANSRTIAAQMTIQGTTSGAANDLRFVAVNLPFSTMALLFDGTTQIAELPFGDGNLCTSGTIARLRVYPGNALGVWDWPLDNATLPAASMLAPGTTTNFQLWYRDVGGPLGTGSNLTNGVQVTLSP